MIDYSKFEGHTPGPWWNEGFTIVSADPKMPGYPWELAEVKNDAFQIGEEDPTEPNGNLIAAAPELLEENKRLREALLYVKGLGILILDNTNRREFIDRIDSALNEQK